MKPGEMNIVDVVQAFVNNPTNMLERVIQAIELTVARAVADERERNASTCDGLALAAKITGGGEWSQEQREAVTTAAKWLASEIRKGSIA